MRPGLLPLMPRAKLRQHMLRRNQFKRLCSAQLLGGGGVILRDAVLAFQMENTQFAFGRSG